ncbi:hypothetical protein BS78_04G003800 [Paspalum vaginatum]|nr:hypothetical protein BS78_04G003800 [Paspalum vaginatum]KAJ1277438.1 hypothetical protein BS78_04G003800 [Paspalum vaginatum]
MWGMAHMDEWKPVMAMLFFNLISAVMTALVKKALEQGLNPLVLITLRQLVATMFLAPIAYFKERNSRPKLTLEIFVYHFFSAVLGAALSQYTFFYGIKFTTATFAVTFANMAPVLTFLIAIALRVESLNVKSKAGSAKLLGTLMSLGGVLLLSLYKGVAVIVHKSTAAAPSSAHHTSSSASSKAGALTVMIERHTSVWIVTNKLEIATILYSGIMASAAGFLIMTWCVHKRGPVFTAAFIPIIQIMVAIIDFLFLHEKLYLGSVLGSVLMICGLYILLWGKKKDASSICCPDSKQPVDEEADINKDQQAVKS